MIPVDKQKDFYLMVLIVYTVIINKTVGKASGPRETDNISRMLQ